MIKEKYDYDELEPEKRQIIKQRFREIIDKRKMSEIEVNDEQKDRETAKNFERPERII